jgi:hypothetical protein
MTFIPWRRMKLVCSGLVLASVVGLAGCAEPAAAPAPVGIGVARPAATAPTTPPGTTSGTTVPGQEAASLDGSGKPVLFNDPPAPPDTALCGRQAREANTIGVTLQGSRVAASGICASFACYDPLTATYVGADGYRHVCR